MGIVTLRNAIETCKVWRGFYGLSFYGDNGLSVEETAKLAKLRNTKLRVSGMYQLREIGHEPERDGEYPHLSLRFPVSPTDDELEELVSVFAEPIPNPHRYG